MKAMLIRGAQQVEQPQEMLNTAQMLGDGGLTLDRFVKLIKNPFFGKPDPTLAEEWLARTEKILDTARIPNSQRLLQTYMAVVDRALAIENDLEKQKNVDTEPFRAPSYGGQGNRNSGNVNPGGRGRGNTWQGNFQRALQGRNHNFYGNGQGRGRGNNPKMFEEFKEEMAREFEMTDIGLMSYYLDIEVRQREDGIFISQEAYAKEILKRYGMVYCKPVKTPVECGVKLSKHGEGDKIHPTFFKSLVGSLRSLLMELHQTQDGPTKILVDNKSALDLAKNPCVSKKEVELEYVKSQDQVADIFTKPLKINVFHKLRMSLGVMNQLGNVRAPIPMHRPYGIVTSASTPSTSAAMPQSQTQTVVVENHMSVDESGKLVELSCWSFTLVILRVFPAAAKPPNTKHVP
ncbi:hypothetical protein RJ640_013471 [Escallonia rubra]|uniref:Reverse transcriptase Ty1/copia-type domain-containing protein n=1 Tax=Escallonia rubra TaxID=112253 RepID=A0AA88UDU0_9ASTE|nr:hypothetical protein RJ640_013471 [Escallonia rubra]